MLRPMSYLGRQECNLCSDCIVGTWLHVLNKLHTSWVTLHTRTRLVAVIIITSLAQPFSHVFAVQDTISIDVDSVKHLKNSVELFAVNQVKLLEHELHELHFAHLHAGTL